MGDKKTISESWLSSLQILANQEKVAIDLNLAGGIQIQAKWTKWGCTLHKVTVSVQVIKPLTLYPLLLDIRNTKIPYKLKHR